LLQFTRQFPVEASGNQRQRAGALKGGRTEISTPTCHFGAAVGLCGRVAEASGRLNLRVGWQENPSPLKREG